MASKSGSGAGNTDWSPQDDYPIYLNSEVTTSVNDLEDKYHNFEGHFGKTNLDIDTLARGVRHIRDTLELGDEGVDEIHKLDHAFGVETSIRLFDRQFMNKLNKTLRQKGYLNNEEIIDHMVETYIYQYNREYRNQRDTNKFLRNEFKNDLLNMTNYLDEHDNSSALRDLARGP